MSTNSIDMESEQNERPSYGSTMRRRVSDTSVPPNTEEVKISIITGCTVY